MVQSVSHTEAEIQQMLNLLQDLESSMNNTKQRQEEVWAEWKCPVLGLETSPRSGPCLQVSGLNCTAAVP